MTWIGAGDKAEKHYENSLPRYVSENSGLGRNRWVELTSTGAGCEEMFFQTMLDYYIFNTARNFVERSDVFGRPARFLFRIPKTLEDAE